MFRAVLFDAAGTLLHVVEPVGETYARLARPFDLELEPSRLQDGFIASFRSMPAMVFAGETSPRIEASERAWWRELVARTFVAATNQPLWPSFDDYFDVLFRRFASADAWRVAPGGRDLLVELRARHVRVGIVSNFDRRLHGIVEALQLRPLLDAVVLPSDSGAAKPDGRIFQLALQRIGVPPAEALYVGDDPEEDLEGARAAGLTPVDVASLATLEDLLKQL
jgi:putative hydrolase of the HAD superfamily